MRGIIRKICLTDHRLTPTTHRLIGRLGDVLLKVIELGIKIKRLTHTTWGQRVFSSWTEWTAPQAMMN
jgi:hypothetical protein